MGFFGLQSGVGHLLFRLDLSGFKAVILALSAGKALFCFLLTLLKLSDSGLG